MFISTSIRSLIVVMFTTALLTSCASTDGGGGNVAGNKRGSEPNNPSEANEYKRAVHKCYKTGGTRVVKIAGKLRCYD
jgi:hypothetical protein